MINLDDRYHSYLGGTKSLRIDGVDEKVKSYGWMDDGKELFNVLKENFNIELLSSPSRAESSRLGKRLWVRNHKLGVKLNLEYSRSKHKHAAPNHVLIDDREDIIKEWESKGGVGILHTSTKNTIECLRKKGILLN